jgi:hypothetical protein
MSFLTILLFFRIFSIVNKYSICQIAENFEINVVWFCWQIQKRLNFNEFAVLNLMPQK